MRVQKTLKAAVFAGLISTAASAPAEAHGIIAHVHVTGWAIQSLPEGELRDFFSDPEVFNAALFGAAFTDSGYWPQGGDLAVRAREYGEHTHWEPYVTDYVEWLRINSPPPWDTLEEKQRVAFLFGNAAHGLQDEIFDSIFLPQVELRDAGGQDSADPGTDGFFVIDGWQEFFPHEFIPMSTLLELYSGLNQEITEDIIRRAVDTMKLLYVNDTTGPEVARSLGLQYESVLPWTRQNYMNPAVPGSIASEIPATAGYMQAIWSRIHGDEMTENPVVHIYPNAPRRLAGNEALEPDAWVTMIFGIGVNYESTEITWTDSEGVAVPFERGNTRWGGTSARLVRVVPTADLTPGENYTVSLGGGAELITGKETTGGEEINFQVECDPPDEALCPPLEINEWMPGDEGSGEPVEQEDASSDSEGVAESEDTTAPGSSSGAGCQMGQRNSQAMAALRGISLVVMFSSLFYRFWRKRKYERRTKG